MKFEAAREHLEAGRVVRDRSGILHKVEGGFLYYKGKGGGWYAMSFTWFQVTGEWTLEPMSDEELAKSWEEAANEVGRLANVADAYKRCARELRARGKP